MPPTSNQAKVFVPHTKINPATHITLWDYFYEPVKTSGKYGYSHYFKQRWAEGESFINVEHDVVVWPGAIDAIRECPEPWCGYDYTQAVWFENEGERQAVHLGCTKISAELIALIPDCWDTPIDWHYCDSTLYAAAMRAGVTPHQHFPGVINANLALMARRRI